MRCRRILKAQRRAARTESEPGAPLPVLYKCWSCSHQWQALFTDDLLLCPICGTSKITFKRAFI